MSTGQPADEGGDATRTGIHAQADLAPGTVLGGRYRIDGVLGIGGMGVVYRAHDVSLDVPVALKLLRPELAHREDVLERFRRELLLARQVSSPHVVRIHDIAQHDGRWLISMDLVDGDSLDHHLDRRGRLPVDEALGIARQIAEGLAAAHAKGVVHRDLKPANILLDAEGQAYVSDFGVARSLAASGQTRVGAVVGTPDYLSPEQARGAQADERSDLYALGLILHEMLAGQPPFEAGTLPEVLARRMVQAPAPLDRSLGLPAWVVRLVDRLLRPQPAHRLQHAQDVVDAIDRRALGRDARGLLRGGLRLAAPILVVLALVAGAAWWQQRQATGPVASAARPLDRLLVMPVSGSGDPAVDAALTARLREGLLAVPGLAVVDGERSGWALRQLQGVAGRVPDAAAVLRQVAANRSLQVDLVRRAGAWQARVRTRAGTGAADWTAAAAANPQAALHAWLLDPRAAPLLGEHAANARLPVLPDAALRAYGAGVLAREAGTLPEAARQFEAAAGAASADPWAWLALAHVAAAMGEDERAADALQRARLAEARVAEPLRPRLAAHRAGLGDDPAAAVAAWLAIARRSPDDAEAALQLARAQGAAGELQAAIDGLLALSARDGNDPRVWYELGKASILKGNAQQAVDDYLTRALVQYKRGRDLYGQAETINALGVGYGRLGQTADAAEQYRQAIELRRKVGNRRGEATSLRNLAGVLSLTGDFDGAERALGQARVIAEALSDREGAAALDNDLGLLAEERGDYPGALPAFQRALRVWQQVGNAQGAAEAQDSIGFVHYQLGNYQDAQVYWQQAAEAYARLGEGNGGVRTRQNLGLLAIAQGRWSVARRLLEQSLADAERQQMVEEAAVSRRNLAELALWQGHPDQAIAQAQQAEASFRSREDARGVADTGLLRAQAQLDKGELDQAAATLDGLAGALADGSSEQQAIGQLLRAELAHARRAPAEAGRALEQARGLAGRSGVRLLQLRIDLFAARGRPDRAARLRALDAPTAALGHAGLRLEWLAQRLDVALQAGDRDGALAAYQEAATWLRAGEFRGAAALHGQGARARLLAGDAAGAEAAEALAQEALAAAARARGTAP